MKDFKNEVFEEIGAKPEQMSIGAIMVKAMIMCEEERFRQEREKKQENE